ncbi:MAG: tetratricopeptide repeat protein [Acidobacteriaceae bacterium]|nr:tetratricopeptide repeat protein [Acidobacteriaceae bacterium]
MRVAVALLLAVSLCHAQKPDAETIFNQALSAQQHGDLEAAVAGYELVLKIDPHLVPARANLAAAQMQLGRTEQALENYRAALKAAPGDPQITLLLGNTLFELSRYTEVRTLLAPFAKTHPDNLDAAFLLGETLIRTQRLREGLPLVERVAKARRDANAYLLAGLTHMQLAEYTEAKASAEQAVRLEPSNPAAWTLDGMAKAAVGELKQAEVAYEKALQLNPNEFDANLRLGTLLLNVDQNMDAAKSYLERALQIDPSSLSARFEVAKIQAALNNNSAAIGNLEQIVARKPDATEAHVQLSTLYARAKRKEDAKREKEIVDRLMAAERESALAAHKQKKNPEDELNAFTSTPPLR